MYTNILLFLRGDFNVNVLVSKIIYLNIFYSDQRKVVLFRSHQIQELYRLSTTCNKTNKVRNLFVDDSIWRTQLSAVINITFLTYKQHTFCC